MLPWRVGLLVEPRQEVAVVSTLPEPSVDIGCFGSLSDAAISPGYCSVPPATSRSPSLVHESPAQKRSPSFAGIGSKKFWKAGVVGSTIDQRWIHEGAVESAWMSQAMTFPRFGPFGIRAM